MATDLHSKSDDKLDASTRSSDSSVNRVTYQGLTFSVCKFCYQVIASDRNAARLRVLEEHHHCPDMDAEGAERNGQR